MTSRVVIDTGPLVAFLNRDERLHPWTVLQTQRLVEPLLVCEPVVTEALYLLRRSPASQAEVLKLIKIGELDITFRLAENASEIQRLLLKYENVPMSLADACIVRMAELNGDCAIFTFDSDFAIYRKHDNKPLKLIMPANHD
jgi:predicted nucleic acid-binding protein